MVAGDEVATALETGRGLLSRGRTMRLPPSDSPGSAECQGKAAGLCVPVVGGPTPLVDHTRAGGWGVGPRKTTAYAIPDHPPCLDSYWGGPAGIDHEPGTDGTGLVVVLTFGAARMAYVRLLARKGT